MNQLESKKPHCHPSPQGLVVVYLAMTITMIALMVVMNRYFDVTNENSHLKNTALKHQLEFRALYIRYHTLETKQRLNATRGSRSKPNKPNGPSTTPPG